MYLKPIALHISRFSLVGALLCSLVLSGCKKDSDNALVDAARGGLAGSSARESCEKDSDCDDRRYCNGEEFCRDEVCVSGRPIVCDDEISCTIDSCDEETEQCTHEAPDADFDGYKDEGCVDQAGVALGTDCDDADPLVSPGNDEICDQENRDEDCDPSTIGQLDDDRDGYNSALCCNAQASGELLCGEDCDDKKTNVNPAATEACDFLDNNCDGETDEGVSISGFADTDHDGRGDPSVKLTSCPGAVGFVRNDSDCNDNDPEVFEGQFEICDEKDNNCNGEVDEVRESAPWFADLDGDTFGDANSVPIFSCERVSGRVLSQNDCNDQNKSVNPAAEEKCDGIDNDCDGKANFKLEGLNDFEDDDNDGVADSACGGEDCNDEDARTAAGAEEVCDRVDNDCDGEVDEQTVQNIWYTDEDGDGWGVVLGTAVASCDPVAGRATQFGDCDDSDSSVRPGVVELCDGVDQDCDGLIDEGASSFCQLDNAISTCTIGNCQIFSCVSGFADVDKNTDNGCEAVVDPSTLITTDECDNDSDCNDFDYCTGTETCVAGFCRLGTAINCQGSSTVIQGNVELKTSQDILALQGIEIITGDLIIRETLLTSLIGLESLNLIGGHLIIADNDRLLRLSGSALSGLERVSGNIIISGNEQLVNVDLPSLVIADSLLITDNESLTQVSGYENLQELPRGFLAGFSSALTKIEGFSRLKTIGGFYQPQGDACPGLRANNRPSNEEENSEDQEMTAPSVSELIDFIGGFYLADVGGLTTFEAFGELESVQGDICLINTHALNVFSLPQLKDVDVNLQVNADGLASLELPLLGQVGGDIYLKQSANEPISGLEKLELPKLERANDLFFVGEFSRLTSIELPALKEVAALRLEFQTTALNPVEFQLSQLEKAGFIQVIYSAPGGITELLFPMLREVECGFRVMTLYGLDTGVLGNLEFPLLEQIGRGTECNTDDSQSYLSFEGLPERGFTFKATSDSASQLRIPRLNDVAKLSIVLQDAFLSSLPRLGDLDIASGLVADESLTIDELDLQGRLLNANLDKISTVNDKLSLCLSGYAAGADYARITSASPNTIVDTSAASCPKAFDCNADEAIKNVNVLASKEEASSFRLEWQYPTECLPNPVPSDYWEQITYEGVTPRYHQGEGYGSSAGGNNWGYDHPSSELNLTIGERSCQDIELQIRLPASSLAYVKESPLYFGVMSADDLGECE